jgi:tetratricopeptide (TPR) repeat protein
MSDSATADDLFAEAARLFRAGRKSEALALTEHVLKLNPGHAEAAHEYARVMRAAGRHEVAEAVLRAALHTNRDNYALVSALGMILLSGTGRTDEGISCLQAAVDIRPDFAPAWKNLGVALKAASLNDRALIALRTATELSPTFADAWLDLGNCLAALDRVDAAVAAFSEYCRLRRGPDLPPIAGDDTVTRTNAAKLRHDIEQLEYLQRNGEIPADPKRIDGYRQALSALPPADSDSAVFDLPPECRARLAPTYNRLWHWRPAPALQAGAINSAINRQSIEADYSRNAPGITYVDDFLRPEALAALREFCLKSTIWFRFRPNGGYLGAYWEQGLWCPLLRQITDELRRALPAIFGAHPLLKAWAYKYDRSMGGIGAHADFAAVNCNFWITPDEANPDPSRGGLVVWDKKPPPDWPFTKYNSDQVAIRQFLSEAGARAVRIPHRQNRMVIFNSDLFHETDGVAFAEGYENRRINITLLYGHRSGQPS